MRQSVGVGVVVAVAVAAMRVAVPSGGASPEFVSVSRPRTVKAASLKAGAVPTAYSGGCTAYDIEQPATQYPRDVDQGAAKSVIDKFFGLDPEAETGSKLHDLTKVHYAIALAADPRHTNLSLMFDRQTVLIQQAAQDEGYTYNSSWFPWRTEAEAYPLLENQEFADDLTDHREACPSILLFRRSLQNTHPATPDDPYAEALVILVVGEQPTGGLNEYQWANAILWLKKNASPKEQNQNTAQDSTRLPRILRILGPTFSGSLVSLDRGLKDIYYPKEISAKNQAIGKKEDSPEETFPGPQTPTRLLSGVIGGCSSIRWFQQRIVDNELKDKIVFGSFSENDELRIYRFLSYLHEQGTRIRDTSILSEDETAYALPNGGPDQKDKTPGACDFPYDSQDRPVRLFYPRDISAIRDAYEKQSVFASPSQSEHSIHPILQEGGAVEGGEASHSSDTIPAYSGRLTAIAQEAILYGIVSNLRIHHTRYLMLRCTNPLDFLFLTRFFHRAYPDGRIVTVGADLLFRREIDTTEFRGVLALSTYPLLPRNQHWSWLSQNDGPPFAHAHRVFESNFEGFYVAGRYLFGTQNNTTPAPASSLTPASIALPLKEDIPDYADPYWLDGSPDPAASRTTAPPTWLTVVGRDGYWPIAVLNERSTPFGKTGLDGAPFDAAKLPSSTLVRLTNAGAHYDRDEPKKLTKTMLFSLPLPWTICAAAAFMLLLYQAYGVWKGGGMTSAGLFTPFRPVATPSQSVLLGINSALAAGLLLQLVAIVIGIPLTEMFVSDAYLPVIYLVGATAPLCVLLCCIPGAFRAGVVRVSFFAVLFAFLAICYAACRKHQDAANNLALFYRMSHITSGVSPVVPMLFLILGLYVWTWQALAGNSLLCCGRPLLPRLRNVLANKGFRRRYLGWLGVSTTATGIGNQYLDPPEYLISGEMEKRIVTVASPLSFEIRVILLPATVFGLAISYMLAFGPPLLSLESQAYAISIDVVLLGAFVLIMAEAARLYFTWVEMRRLLSALNRLRLRRTMAKLAAIAPGSLWSVSGGVQRIQFHFFTLQLDAANRLNNITKSYGNVSNAVESAVVSGLEFARVTANRLDTGPRWEEPIARKPTAADPRTKVLIREQFNDAVAEVLKALLIEWDKEELSLNVPKRKEAAAESGEITFEMELSEKSHVCAAEEFVCLHYIAFIQNILGRMRTMTLSMVSVFVSVCLAISFYPFVPRTQIGTWMIANLLLIAAAVVYVYAGMERNETLSHITNTPPGRLGGEFYLKTAGFLAGPVIGLLTTQFPSISESVLGWLQPGLDALK